MPLSNFDYDYSALRTEALAINPLVEDATALFDCGVAGMDDAQLPGAATEFISSGIIAHQYAIVAWLSEHLNSDPRRVRAVLGSLISPPESSTIVDPDVVELCERYLPASLLIPDELKRSAGIP